MQLIRPGTLVPGRELVPARSDIPDGPVALRAVSDEREEAEAVAAEIEKLLGGASFHALDSRAVDGRDRVEHQLSFSDFAVLYRTSAQAAAVGEALARRGFPCQRRSHSRLAETPGVPEILAALGDRARWTPACRTPARLDAGRCRGVAREGGRRGPVGGARHVVGAGGVDRVRWSGRAASIRSATPNSSGPRRSRRSVPPPTCSPRWRAGAAPTWTGSSMRSPSGPRSTPGIRGPTGSRC